MDTYPRPSKPRLNPHTGKECWYRTGRGTPSFGKWSDAGSAPGAKRLRICTKCGNVELDFKRSVPKLRVTVRRMDDEHRSASAGRFEAEAQP
jgi:hypothetical protein